MDSPTNHASKEGAERAIALYTLWLTVFTGVLAVATIALALFTGWLYRATAGMQTLAANQEEITKILQRARLSVTPQGIMPSADKYTAVSHVHILNVGHLPAKNVTWFLAVTPSSDINMSAFKIDEGKVHRSGVLFPGGVDRRGSEPTKFPEAEIRSEAEGKLGHIYVWGQVWYDDGFGKQCWTKFCHRYPRAREIRPENGGVQIDAEHARSHHHGNDAT